MVSVSFDGTGVNKQEIVINEYYNVKKLIYY